MSLPTRSVVQIRTKWGDLEGTETILQTIHNIIQASLKLAVKETISLMNSVVPDSSPRVLAGGYSPKYRSEFLNLSAQKILNDSLLSIGTTFKSHYSLKYGYPASYAQFVDKMRGVDWSTAGTHGGFVKEVRDFLITRTKELVAIGLNSVRANKLQATKYIGSQQYKKKVGGVQSRAGPSPGDNAVWEA